MKDKLNVPQFNVLDFSYGMKSWLQKELQDNIWEHLVLKSTLVTIM